MNYTSSFHDLFKSVFRNRNLIIQMTKRNIVGKYKGSVMGVLWSFFNPVIMLGIYTFAFSVVFKAKWGIENEGHLDYALILFASLTIFNLFGDVLKDSPTLVISQPNYVKKVIFPLEILPVISLAGAFIHTLISLCVFFVIYLLSHGFIPWTIIFLPVILIPLILISVGISYTLASLGVYIRDIGYFMNHLITILMFTSPVFFSLDRIPAFFQKFIFLNPIAYILENARLVMVFGKIPQWDILAIYSIAGLISAYFGFWWFQKTRKGFADVI